MFSQVWKKYIPVITILLKRSVNGEQSLDMNHTDFERAAGGRKVKFSFNSLELDNGRITNVTKLTPLARELALLLQDEESTRNLIRKMQLEFSMNNNFQLLIKNHTPKTEPAAEEEEKAK